MWTPHTIDDEYLRQVRAAFPNRNVTISVLVSHAFGRNGLPVCGYDGIFRISSRPVDCPQCLRLQAEAR